MHYLVATCPCTLNVFNTILVCLGLGATYVTAIRRIASYGRECVAEVIGTYILVFFGIGSIHVAVLTGALQGLWQVGIVWGTAVTLAIYATSAVSGSHINPAITVSFAIFRKFPWKKVPLFLVSQLVGAVLAAATLYFLFDRIIQHFEAFSSIIRGTPGSELSAMIYGEYFPNPVIAKAMTWDPNVVSIFQAMTAEGLGTAFLAFFVFSMTDSRNHKGPGIFLQPVFIGLAVSIVIVIITPITQSGLNPARDFGPRLFSWFAGWEKIAIPGPRGGFFAVYILSPIIGSMVGAAIYELLIRPGIPAVTEHGNMQSACNCDCSCRNPVATTGNLRAGVNAPVRLILVGGFLGAGKTSLLCEAAQRLAVKGKSVGLITNDQAPDLVDTALLGRTGIGVQEVAGSCFCCDLPALVGASQTLVNNNNAEIIIAEPVGSCTDLSATIIQPLKDKFAADFVLSPLTVLADPARVKEILSGQSRSVLHDSASYIYRKQLEEADVILLNKTDLLSADQQEELLALVTREFPETSVMCASALTGKGIDEWIDMALTSTQAGMKVVKVDYDVYAEGEAVLGWLNAVVRLSCNNGLDWRTLCHDLMAKLQTVFQQKQAEVGHIKIFLSVAGGFVVANLTGTNGEISIRGTVEGLPSEAQLVINARVQMPPDELERILRQALAGIAGSSVRTNVIHLQSLSPGRPKPTYRYGSVV